MAEELLELAGAADLQRGGILIEGGIDRHAPGDQRRQRRCGPANRDAAKLEFGHPHHGVGKALADRAHANQSKAVPPAAGRRGEIHSRAPSVS